MPLAVNSRAGAAVPRPVLLEPGWVAADAARVQLCHCSCAWARHSPICQTTGKRQVLLAAITMGVVAMAYHVGWWFDPAGAINLFPAPLLLLALAYDAVQVLSAWHIYAHVRRPAPRQDRPGLRVDVFVPAYDEEGWLVARSLAPAIAIDYPHRTFLLDDAHKDSYRQLARRLRAVYVRRSDHLRAKAGNGNHALQFSDADFLAIFDVDHIPEPTSWTSSSAISMIRASGSRKH